MPDKYRQYLPLGISAGIHLLLLIMMMLYYLPLMKQETWYEVSWSDSVVQEMPEEIQAEIAVEQAGLPQQAVPVQPVRQAPPSVRPSAPLNPPASDTDGPPRLGESEVVEAPIFKPLEPAIKAPASLRSSPVATSALRETVSGIPTNSTPGSVDSEIEGGKLIRTDTKVRTHSFGDYGEVKLSFSVDMSARLDESSIRVIQSQNSKFDAEAIRVLKDMTFSFRGRPDPDKPYTIRIKFSP